MDGYCANKNGYIVIKLYGEIPYSEPFSPGIGPSLCPPSGSWESLWPIAAGSHSPRNPKFGRVRFFFLGSLASSCLFLNIHGPYQLGCSLILTSFQGHIHCSWWHLNLVTVYSLSSHSFLKYHVCSHPWPLVLSEDRVPQNLMVQTLRKRIVPLTLPWIEGKSGSFQTYLYHSLD